MVKSVDTKQSDSTYKTTFKIEQSVGLKTRCDAKDAIYEQCRKYLTEFHGNKIIADAFMRINNLHYSTIQDAFKSIDSLIFQIGANVSSAKLREEATAYSSNLTFERFETHLLQKYEFMAVAWLGIFTHPFFLVFVFLFFCFFVV